jgi:hypothetical protein
VEDEGHGIEVVIHTASAVLLDRLAPHEAMTILATQVAPACTAARHLGGADPKRAAAYAALIRDLGRQLRDRAASDPAPHLRALVDDLARVVRAFPVTDRGG